MSQLYTRVFYDLRVSYIHVCFVTCVSQLQTLMFCDLRVTVIHIFWDLRDTVIYTYILGLACQLYTLISCDLRVTVKYTYFVTCVSQLCTLIFCDLRVTLIWPSRLTVYSVLTPPPHPPPLSAMPVSPASFSALLNLKKKKISWCFCATPWSEKGVEHVYSPWCTQPPSLWPAVSVFPSILNFHWARWSQQECRTRLQFLWPAVSMFPSFPSTRHGDPSRSVEHVYSHCGLVSLCLPPYLTLGTVIPAGADRLPGR